MNKIIDLSKSVQKWPKKIILKRIIWSMVWPVFKYLPKIFSGLRIYVLRLMGASIGENCLVMPGVKVLMPWNLRIGNYVAIGARVDIYNFAEVFVGDMTVISQDVFICTGSHDYCKYNMPLIYYPISVGNNVWISARVILLPGVTIAEGVVVGLGSIITKSITESWVVFAGIPAKFVSNRVVELK